MPFGQTDSCLEEKMNAEITFASAFFFLPDVEKSIYIRFNMQQKICVYTANTFLEGKRLSFCLIQRNPHWQEVIDVNSCYLRFVPPEHNPPRYVFQNDITGREIHYLLKEITWSWLQSKTMLGFSFSTVYEKKNVFTCWLFTSSCLAVLAKMLVKHFSVLLGPHLSAFYRKCSKSYYANWI